MPLSLGITKQGPGCGPRKHVAFTVGKGRKAHLAADRLDFKFRLAAKNSGGDSLADRDIAAVPIALGIQIIKARARRADLAA
jgi:hypothetical protein